MPFNNRLDIDMRAVPTNSSLVVVGAHMFGFESDQDPLYTTVAKHSWASVLLVEASWDMELVIPLMCACAFSTLVTKLIHEEGFDEQLVRLKKVPLLLPEMDANIT